MKNNTTQGTDCDSSALIGDLSLFAINRIQNGIYACENTGSKTEVRISSQVNTGNADKLTMASVVCIRFFDNIVIMYFLSPRLVCRAILGRVRSSSETS